VSRIFAISKADRDPLAAHRKSSKAVRISASVLNSWHRNVCILSQKSGSETTSRYVDSVDEGMIGLLLASSVRTTSFSTPGLSFDGDGDSTTLGMRWCLPFEAPGVPREPPRPLKGLGEGPSGEVAIGEVV